MDLPSVWFTFNPVKNWFYSVGLIVFCLPLIQTDCGGTGGPPDTPFWDSIEAVDSQQAALALYEMLNFNSGMNLERLYPGAVIVNDTIAEDSLEQLRTTIRFDSHTYVVIIWSSTGEDRMLECVALRADSGASLVDMSKSKFITGTKLQLGMTLMGVSFVNEKPFSIYGFRHDNPGSTSSWNNGYLSAYDVNVKFTIPDSVQLTDADRLEVFTFDTVSCSNIAANRSQMYVEAIVMCRK